MNAAVRKIAVALPAILLASDVAAFRIDVSEDVMTSSFFTGANLVRGYPGDSRPVLRVSTDGAFGLSGAETIYLRFDHDFASVSSPVQAVLTLQSVSGGFGADASASAPFTVSAHGVNADPFSSIVDDTNPGGSTDWLGFYTNNVLSADGAAHTAISGFGPVSFDVSAIVNSWISGANSFHAIALTGRNDISGTDFLHGFLNNTEASGSTFLTVTAVPEPETYALMLAGLGIVAFAARRKASSRMRLERA